MKVLIAEDDLTSRDILAELLKKNGYEVILTENGTDAWSIIQQPDSPHMVILDWLMPGLDGLEVCRLIRTLKREIPPYVIMLTIKGNKEDIIKGLDIGADDYLSKPYDPGELRARVDVGRRILELEEKLTSKIDELAVNHERFRSFVENANDIIYTLTKEGILNYVSPNWTAMLGHNVDEVIGHSLTEFVHPDDASRSMTLIEQLFDTAEKRGGFVYRVRHKNSTWRWHTTNASIIPGKNGESGTYLGVARDITRRKEDQDKIRSLLSEKELLLKEVHHRIKNNMNTIKSLLVLQAGTMTDPSAVSALNDAGNRIQSMMVMYDKLYHSTSFDFVPVNNYLPSLIDEIVMNFPNCGIVKIEKDIDDFTLDVKKIQPLGILINEIITNIMKYAFSGRDCGIINVSCKKVDTMVTVIISDNGIGIPESVDFENSTGFGLQLVSMLTGQIGGSIRIVRGGGSKFILEFNL